jgi:hypothetical protein
MLASAQFCKQHDFTAWKFHRIVVDSRVVHVDLPKPGDLCAGFSSKKWKPAIVLDFFLKCDLRAWKETYCNLWIFDRRKTARYGVVENHGLEFISDLGRTGHYIVQAIVAHANAPLCCNGCP